MKEIEQYAVETHGIQAILYYLGYRYHKNRNNKLYAGLSLALTVFHAWSVVRHAKDLEE